MPGLLSNSASFRKTLESKNYFTPDNVYDLNSDVVTKTLNTLQNAGFSLRQNPIISAIERQVDNTQLVKIGNERLLVEFGRRFIDNVVSNYKVNVNALFDKNNNTKFLSKNTDFRITPSTKNTGTANKILNFIKTNEGIIDESGKELFSKPQSSSVYYNNLGVGQKQQLNTLIGYNYYGNWAVTNVFKPQGIDIRTNTFTDARVKPGKGQGMSYISGVFNIANQPDPFAENKYTADLNGSAPAGFVEVLSAGSMPDTALDIYNFGRTSVSKDSTTDPNQYRDTSADLKWGEQTTFPANAERGLLYFTNNIVKTRTAVSKLIDQTNKSYVVDNTLVYKGTKCRSWIVNNQYDQFSKAIRFVGNGVEGSVLKDSVFVHQYPRLNDTNEDKKRYMLSLENLAWTNEDFITYNIPDCEKGAFGGRIMWFPFYGVEFSEATKAEYNSNKYIGRIEPLYSYAGAERTATLSFNLIMDYPSNIKDFRGNEAAFFANCNNMANGATSMVVTNSDTAATNKLQTKDQSSTPAQNNKPSFSDLEYFFDNDIFTVDLSYESTESNTPPISYGLNKNFYNKVFGIAMILASKNANNYSLQIDGYASQLATNDYNAQLGFKRAYNLMNYIQTITNSIADTSDTNLNLTANKNFIDESFSDKTVNDVSKTKVVFKDNNRNIVINLTSVGESQASITGQSAKAIDNKEVKEDRKALFHSIGPLSINDNTEDTTILKPTPVQIQATIDNNNILATADVATQTNNCNPFLEYTADAKFPIDYNKLSFFRPAYHSQTPEDFHKRLTFLNQITRPGSTIAGTTSQGTNSIFGRMPVCNLRIGDFQHTKVIIQNVAISYENLWDLNPEGMGVQPMVAKVTLDMIIIGGQSLKTPIDRLQRAVDFNYYGNSTFYGKDYYSKPNPSGGTPSVNQTTNAFTSSGVGPYYQQMDQVFINGLK